MLTLTAWLQHTYKIKMPAGGWKKLKAPQLRAACEERKIALKPKEKPAAMVKKLTFFQSRSASLSSSRCGSRIV